MPEIDEKRWEEARLQMVVRWRAILERIDQQDEGGVLELVNSMDEFCEEAIRARDAAPENEGIRCLFCKSFIEQGGCFGLLQEINRALLHHQWDTAHGLAEKNLRMLEAADFSDAAGPGPARG